MAELPFVHVSRPPEEPTGNTPSVVLLHGYGGDEHNMIGIEDRLPDDLHAFGVRGPFEVSNGYAWFPGSSRSRGGFQRGIDQLAAFVRGLPEEYDVAPDRIGLYGFSQGAMASLAALVDYPDLLRWVAALNGYLPGSHDDPELVSNARGEPVFVAAGEEDTVIPPENAERTADLLADAGADVTFRTYPVGHRMIGREFRDISNWLGSRR